MKPVARRRPAWRRREHAVGEMLAVAVKLAAERGRNKRRGELCLADPGIDEKRQQQGSTPHTIAF